MTQEMINARIAGLKDENGQFISYAWPGGYQMIYLTSDGLDICPKCANTDTSDPVIAGDVYWEGTTIYCDYCQEPIESAYGDPDEADEVEA